MGKSTETPATTKASIFLQSEEKKLVKPQKSPFRPAIDDTKPVLQDPIHFGEGSMQRCEIMLHDLIDSKRVSINIKKASQTGAELGESELSVDTLTSTIMQIDIMKLRPLVNYFGRKILALSSWSCNLKTDLCSSVSPTQAAIIMQFQEKKSWTSIDLATIIGIPIDAINRRVNLWISKGVLRESTGTDSYASVYTLVESMTDSGKKEREELLTGDEDSGNQSPLWKTKFTNK